MIMSFLKHYLCVDPKIYPHIIIIIIIIIIISFFSLFIYLFVFSIYFMFLVEHLVLFYFNLLSLFISGE